MEAASLDDHSRTIVHLDLDCFYAQVEMLKDPKLRQVPLGIQQKNIVVTSNYEARKYGLTKCMLISEAKELCPGLVLANGEDLHDYRQTSYKVTSLLQAFSGSVERLGLDENYVDVSKLVQERLDGGKATAEVAGKVFGSDSLKCQCGCFERLIVGSAIAQEMRGRIRADLGLTSCAGIAHNKLLAKIAGALHKPDQQTTVFPNSALELMLGLKSVTSIPGIGRVTGELLEGAGIHSIQELQSTELKRLERLLNSPEKARTVHQLSFGCDPSPVKSSGKPLSIGLEDSCKSISAEKEVREKLGQLLKRLMLLVAEDGRLPKTIRLTVRKFDKESRNSHRETRQCNISPAFFAAHHKVQDREEKILGTVMHLFGRAVDMNRPYHVTLLGLALTKFQEPPRSNSIASFLRRSLEVQSVTSIENNDSGGSPNSPSPSTPSTSGTPCSPHPGCSSPSPSLSSSSASPSPSPRAKRPRLEALLAVKRRRLDSMDSLEDCASPSKLRVQDLSLGGGNGGGDVLCCPPDVDEQVFGELPRDVQQELWDDYRRKARDMGLCGSQAKKTKPNGPNTLLNYFIRNN